MKVNQTRKVTTATQEEKIKSRENYGKRRRKKKEKCSDEENVLDCFVC